MKRFLSLGLALLVLSCSATKNTTKATAATGTTDAPATTDAKLNTVQVRVKNSSKLLITNITINNGNDDLLTFDNIKANKTSDYKQGTNICNCGYNIVIAYQTETGMQAILKDCVNVMPCTDYFKGKLKIDVIGTDPVANKVELNFITE